MQQSAEELLDLMALLPGVIFIFGVEADSMSPRIQFHYVSPQVTTYFNLSPEASSFFDRFVAGLSESGQLLFIGSLMQAVRHEQEWFFEGKFLCAKRGNVWFRVHARPKRDPVSGELLYSGVFIDLTGRKRMEEQLQWSEKRYKLLFDGAGDAILLVRDGVIVDCNEQTRLLFACSREEIVGHQADEFAPQWCPQSMHPEGGAQGRFEWTMKTHGGRLFSAEVSLTLVSLGSEHYQLAMIRDITERQRFQQILSENEERYRSLMTTMAQGLALHEVVLNPQGEVIDYTFLDINPRYEELTGLKRADVLGKRVLEVLPNLEPYWIQRYGRTALTGEVIHYEDYTQALGRYYEVIAYRPRERQFAVLVNDVTNRKQMEQDLIQAKEAAIEANAAKTTFLANISHEIRTPLNILMGYGEELADSCQGCNNPIRPVQRAVMKQAGETLLSVINSVLDLTKIDAGKMELDVTPLDLPTHLSEFLQLMQVAAHKKSIELISHLEIPSARQYRGDGGKIRQILMNLVSNAIKFTEQGYVRVLATYDVVKSELHVEVHDTGPGIPLDKQSALFDSFYQVDNSITRRYGGTGLGLALAKKFVHLMQGQIRVQSEGKQGSSFFVDLPVESHEVQDTAATAAPAEAFKGARRTQSAIGQILIVDDSEENRNLIKAFLRRYRLEISEFSSGEETLKKLDYQRYDLVLMDVQMPGLDGYQTTRKIREREQEMKIAVPNNIVACTAHAFSEDIAAAFQAGCSDHLAKPIRKDKLIALLKKFAVPVEEKV